MRTSSPTWLRIPSNCTGRDSSLEMIPKHPHPSRGSMRHGHYLSDLVRPASVDSPGPLLEDREQ